MSESSLCPAKHIEHHRDEAQNSEENIVDEIARFVRRFVFFNDEALYELASEWKLDEPEEGLSCHSIRYLEQQLAVAKQTRNTPTVRALGEELQNRSDIAKRLLNRSSRTPASPVLDKRANPSQV